LQFFAFKAGPIVHLQICLLQDGKAIGLKFVAD
jgi:hypothetical protein